MSLYNSNNGQHRLRFNFGKKFTPKPLNPELSEQENMMNMIKDLSSVAARQSAA